MSSNGLLMLPLTVSAMWMDISFTHILICDGPRLLHQPLRERGIAAEGNRYEVTPVMPGESERDTPLGVIWVHCAAIFRRARRPPIAKLLKNTIPSVSTNLYRAFLFVYNLLIKKLFRILKWIVRAVSEKGNLPSRSRGKAERAVGA